MHWMTARTLPIIFIVASALSGCCKKGEVGDSEECKLGAVDVCSKECDAGKLEQCVILGRSYQMGEPKTDRVKAMAIFLKACDAGHAPACVPLARMVLNSHYKETHNPRTAEALYKKACDGGVEDACVTNILLSFDTDKAKVFKQLEERCNSGKTRSCSTLAWMYRSGHHVPEDKPKALKMWQDGCAKSDQHSCTELGTCYNQGYGTEENKAKAAELWTKACNEGYGEACAEHAVSLREPQKEFELEKKACALYNDLGCILLARAYETGKEGVVEKDLNLALKHYMQACTLGWAEACDDATKVMVEAAAK